MSANRFNFRAWYPNSKRMHGDIELTFGREVYLSRVAEGSPAPILMQSTGLTDKNGKEIFEGDIVRWPWPRIGYGEDGLERRWETSDWVVKWHPQTGWFPFIDPDHEGGNFIDKPEVIGNVHENPELLK